MANDDITLLSDLTVQYFESEAALMEAIEEIRNSDLPEHLKQEELATAERMLKNGSFGKFIDS